MNIECPIDGHLCSREDCNFWLSELQDPACTRAAIHLKGYFHHLAMALTYAGSEGDAVIDRESSHLVGIIVKQLRLDRKKLINYLSQINTQH